MLAASINFVTHFNLWVSRSPGQFFKDIEVKNHFAILALATAGIYVAVALQDGSGSELSFRRALFQATSILTSTGFVTYDYEQWPPFTHLLLLILMYIGGNTDQLPADLKHFELCCF